MPRLSVREIETDVKPFRNAQIDLCAFIMLHFTLRCTAKICGSERCVYSRTGNECSRNHHKTETKVYVFQS